MRDEGVSQVSMPANQPHVIRHGPGTAGVSAQDMAQEFPQTHVLIRFASFSQTIQ